MLNLENIRGNASIDGANYFSKKNKEDTIQFLTTSASTHLNYFFDDNRVKYSYNRWQAILASSSGGIVYVKTGFLTESPKQILNLRGKPLRFALQSLKSPDIVAFLSIFLFDITLRPILNTRGRSAALAAFRNNEVDIDYQSTEKYTKHILPLAESGQAVALFSFGSLDERGHVIRDPQYPGLPHFLELYQQVTGKKTNTAAFKTWTSLCIHSFAAQKMLFVKKNIAKKYLNAFDKAFVQIIGDSNFQYEKNLSIGAYPQHSGKQAKFLADMIGKNKKASRRWLKRWLGLQSLLLYPKP